MPTPSYDPNLPADGSPMVAAEMRGQFEGLKAQLEAEFAQSFPVAPLSLTVSNPPTQAQVQAILNKLNEVINALQGA